MQKPLKANSTDKIVSWRPTRCALALSCRAPVTAATCEGRGRGEQRCNARDVRRGHARPRPAGGENGNSNSQVFLYVIELLLERSENIPQTI